MTKKTEAPRVGTRDIWSARLRAVDGNAGYPYLSDALFALVPVITEQVDTLAVDRHGRVYVNPVFFAGCTPDEGAAVLAHEVWHLLLRHFERADRLNVRPEEADILNVSQDCEINIKDDLSKRLPGDCCLPENFGLPPRGLFEEYFHALRKTHPQLLRKIVQATVRVPGSRGGASAKGDGGGSKPSPSSDASSPSRGRGVGSGKCGSCAHGHPEAYELPAPGEADEDGNVCQTPGVSPPRWDVIARATAQKILEHSRSRGSVPAGWLRWAEDLLVPKVDWRKALPTMVMGMFGRRRGYTWTDCRKISRRQNPDPRILRPAHVNSLPNVDVVADTSGSMSEMMLAQSLAEVAGILAAMDHAARVNVHPTDAAAAECQKVFRADQIKLIGGGGTDMGAGLEAVHKRVRREPWTRPHLVVVITDCYTPWPEAAPPWPVLVVHLGGGGTIPPWIKPPDHDVLVIPNDEPD